MTEPMELAYEERGAGPVLALVHGFPLDRTMWIGQLAGLASLRRVVAVDLRGHGLSKEATPAGAYSMDLFADDLAKTLDELGVEKADICGLSMGGYVVFAFWRRHRDRVRSLILCDTKSEADSDEAKAARDGTAKTALEKGLEPIWEALRTKMFGPNPSDDVLERTHRMFLGVPPEVAAADALAMRDRPDASPDLESIDVPVLWINGEDDLIMPVDHAEITAKRIPGARFARIPGGHLAPMESPAEANTHITEFLGSIG